MPELHEAEDDGGAERQAHAADGPGRDIGAHVTAGLHGAAEAG